METRPSRVGKSRPAKACNTCRRKKVKCDGKRPKCSSCTIFDLPCGYDNTTKTPGRFSRAYVEEPEQRVKHLDDQLQRLSQDGIQGEQSSQDSYPLKDTRTPEVACSNFKSPHDTDIFADSQLLDRESSAVDQENPDQLSYTLRASDGKMRYFGPSSSISIPYYRETNRSNPKNLQLTQEHASRRTASDWPLTNWVPRILQDRFEQRVTQPLPSKATTIALVTEFSVSFNRIIPLIDDKSLLRLVDRQFSWNPEDSPSSWILLNVAIAFSYKERAQASEEASDDWKKSLGHIKNALNVLVDIFLRHADLHAVQGLLGLAVYFQGTPNPQALFMFAASAMRLSHSIGLHTDTISGFSPSEIEERRRTFWIALILDADISMRVGRPPAQDMEDYNTPLPAETPSDGKGIISIDGASINFFRLLAKFAVIQRDVYRRLLRATVNRQPRNVTLEAAISCEKALLEWRSFLPDIYQPQNMSASEPQYFREQLLRLHLAYYCCYTKLRQISLFIPPPALGPLGSPIDVDQEINDLCARSLASARSALILLPSIRSFGSEYKWNVLYFFATASVTLSSELQIHPSHPHAHDDIARIRKTTEFLRNVSEEEPCTFVDFILSVCSDLKQSARSSVHHAQKDKALRPASGMDNDTIGLDLDFTGQHHSNNYTDSSLLDNEAVFFPDPNNGSFNLQSTIPPFWNWQDLFVNMPSTPK